MKLCALLGPFTLLVSRTLTASTLAFIAVGPAHAQFQFAGSGTVSAGPIHPEPVYGEHGSLAASSTAYHRGSGLLHRQASHNNQVCIVGIGCSAVNGHTISGPFRSGQAFTCGSFSFGMNPSRCAGTKYYRKPICPFRYFWSATAAVSTQKRVRWSRDLDHGDGLTGCAAPPPPPPPPPCSAGSVQTEYIVLPLDGRVSEMPTLAAPSEPLTQFETIRGESFFVNEHVVVEKAVNEGLYRVVAASQHAGEHEGEALIRFAAATSASRVAPTRALIAKVSRHGMPDRTMAPAVYFDRPILVDYLSNDRGQGDSTLRHMPSSGEPWRFAAKFDVRDALGQPRLSSLIWSERRVPRYWLERLSSSITLQFHGNQEHRTVVYAVVEVNDRQLTVRSSVVVRPQCCCNEVLCL